MSKPTPRHTTLPVALTIAGSDSSGGAGIQADLKTFTAQGVYGASVLTALTAQNTTGVAAVHQVPADFVSAQMAAVGSDLQVRATKTGMLFDASCINAIADTLEAYSFGPVIVDPVMIATSGDQLLADDAVDAMKSKMFPHAELITPNLAEAARLLDGPKADSVEAMIEQATALFKLGCQAVLVKGGHSHLSQAVDVLFDGVEISTFAKPRIDTRNKHGTGCTLSAAIAANRAKGLALHDAIDGAKTYVWEALVAAKDVVFGKGQGPLDHVYKIKGGH
ncbi:MAG: bifunctional hydroxymethylpyrimidine kinase/phosphomethylpyrimidine kinase [Hyphomicrobiaceae bacterium]